MKSRNLWLYWRRYQGRQHCTRILIYEWILLSALTMASQKQQRSSTCGKCSKRVVKVGICC